MAVERRGQSVAVYCEQVAGVRRVESVTVFGNRVLERGEERL